ncbi:hypothetical protein PG999_011735 [Apiospora kogelbergensis]|uniref:PHD and RING finger domain-containing protein n=1 Tax=Apiospora kogelbergensis TaxID=1337665 RepID=A0AAW0QPJ8_9PEZI
MADQCIVCLESLDVHPLVVPPLQESDPDVDVPHDTAGAPADASTSASDSTLPVSVAPAPTTPTKATHTEYDGVTSTSTPDGFVVDEDSKIAEIEVCGHVLHDVCLRQWTGKANSCPICRQTFNSVIVYDSVGGNKLDSYAVADKKQIAEFDAPAWMAENPEPEEPAQPCPICNRSDQEEILLLCDSCDAPYHTHCIGLDHVPRGHWFCMECAEEGAALAAAELVDPASGVSRLAGSSDHQSDFMPRTQATLRRERQRARSAEWQGAWGEIAGRVWDVLDIDLNNPEEDEALLNYRRVERQRGGTRLGNGSYHRSEFERWQQRLHIADRLGSLDVFTNGIPQGRSLARSVRQATPPPPPPQETPEEKEAWGALEMAKKALGTERPAEATTPNPRKRRKSRSTTASPREPAPEPERKLKRPRTRRVHHDNAEASSSRQPQAGPSSSSAAATIAAQPSAQTSPSQVATAVPSFLSTLLKEVEQSTPSDDESVRTVLGVSKTNGEHSSPATSPSPSAYSSPRALSATPPPRGLGERSASPLTLTSRIEPIYPPANFSPNRSGSPSRYCGSDSSDSESKPHRQQHSPKRNGTASLEIRHPRPRRQHTTPINTRVEARSPESSPTRGSPTRIALPLETKENISAITKAALKPHFRAGSINADQYTAINRDLSRKLYMQVPDEGLDHDTRIKCETLASKEVAKAVADLKAAV